TGIGANWLAIDSGPDSTAHLVVSASYDGDGYNEIYYTNNTSATFEHWELIADGWYDSGSGNYFYYPSIKVADGYWHIDANAMNWGGRVSWSDMTIALWTDEPGGIGGSAGSWGWYAISLGRKSLARDADGNYRVVFGTGSVFYHGFVDVGGWVNDGGRTGNQPQIGASDVAVGVAYNDGTGLIVYIEDAGSGFGEPVTIGRGSWPVPALVPGGPFNVAFLMNVAGVDQVALWTELAAP
ncbi:MAG: hypothetical protein JXR83_13115, partial [Deltaproteobacteria bacterium]|nr:hypothetical protein [Deltaproteobacteria bacterium]